MRHRPAPGVTTPSPPGRAVISTCQSTTWVTFRPTTFAATLGSGEVGGQDLDVFLAGDDEDANGTGFGSALKIVTG